MVLFVRVLAGALAAGLLWAAFFPGMAMLAWVALVPLFWAVDGAGVRRGAAVGATFGVLFFALEFSSLLSLRPFVGGVAFLVCGALAIYGALFAVVFAGVGGIRASPLLWAGAWTLLEVARAAGPLGFTFGSLPAAVSGTPFLSASALGGPWLLSLGVAWTAGCLARGLRRRRWLPGTALGPLALLALAWASPALPPQGALTVALVQPNIPQADRLDPERLPDLVARYRELLAGIAPPLDLVVVPENALPAFLRQEPEHLALFQDAARRLNATLLVGTGDFRSGRIYNTILVLSPAGEVVGTYAKTHLVPFGEYVPGREIWRRLGLGPLFARLLPVDQAPGEGVRPVGSYGVMICFESTFPAISRELARGGAEVLLTPTNDAWFGRTRILWEHYALGALRAAETGRAFVQAGQTGFTGGWGPSGKDLGRLPPWEQGVLTLRVPLYTGLTPYARVGDGPALALAGALALLGFIPKKRPRPCRAGPRRSVIER
ncbi:MAG: apolipoprotein N-acyltransferase [Candidatus Acetothermia bacterium]|nr:apolipoprotein N-acyltransferase [Candidatus Acetothermia bacterium]